MNKSPSWYCARAAATRDRVDAMLTHLINAGRLDEVAGILVGEMTNTDTGEQFDKSIARKPWREIVIERLAPLGYVRSGFSVFGLGLVRSSDRFSVSRRCAGSRVVGSWNTRCLRRPAFSYARIAATFD